MKKIDFSYFVERYVTGDMNDDEKKWFEKELEGNEKLRKDVELSRSTDEILKKRDIALLRSKLSEIEKQHQISIPVNKTRKPVYLKYAAVVTGLALISSVVIFSGRTLSSEEIIDRYYKTYEPPSTQRSALTISNSDFTMALDLYNTHNYEKAAILFNKVLKTNPKDMQSTLLYGVANFEDKKYPDAKQSFVNVINDNNNLFIESAKWYLALCYVKTNDKEKAVQQLKMIKSEGGIYKNDAKKIIRRLK
jgi:tetratricopeptide (TPR) repeat protein